ncbi:MAG TPA: hypothetical protein VKS82_01445 [Streptosporangiaceae bacterium]|jgi:hypothetical protein|nr:hypothetical protein [Streptosporangiaceae bacterium]
MPTTRMHSGASAVRAEALFVSPLQQSGNPSALQVRRATAAALRQFGSLGCAERVAQEFGDHPELAADRMRWARLMVAGTSRERIPRQPAAQEHDQLINRAA